MSKMKINSMLSKTFSMLTALAILTFSTTINYAQDDFSDASTTGKGLTNNNVHTKTGERENGVEPLGKNYDFYGNDLADFAVLTFPTAGGSIRWFVLKNENPSPTGPGQASIFDVTWGLTASDSVPNVGDYDGNGTTDLSLYRSSTGTDPNTYYTLPVEVGGQSVGNPLYQQWGNSTTDFIGAEGDYDGDGKLDYTAVRDTGGSLVWYVLQSSDSTVAYFYFGTTSSDIPLGGADYTGNGIDDPTVIRIGGGGVVTWYVGDTNSQIQNAVVWGDFNTDFLVPGGDYDGDGKADYVTWRGFGSGTDGSWNILTSQGVSSSIPFGTGGTAAVRDTALRGGDYDGDGKDDIAVYRNASGQRQFRILKSSDASTLTQTWGVPGNTNLPVSSFGVH